jgi:hypothetical protein
MDIFWDFGVISGFIFGLGAIALYYLLYHGTP